MTEVNGAQLDLIGRYLANSISIRRYRNHSVPNCNDFTLVMWVFCETCMLEMPEGGVFATEMIKFVICGDEGTLNRDLLMG